MTNISNKEVTVVQPLKNTLVLAFSSLSIYSAFQGIQNIQSSINQKEGLGVASLACVYAFLIISSMLSPLYIHFAGLKLSIILAFICHCLYTISNFYPDWWSLIPSSILLGLSVSPMLVAKHVYINAMGQYSSVLDKVDPHVSLSRHNGLFFFFTSLAHVIGNFISSAVLHQSSNDQSDFNQTRICGADDCPGDVNKTTVIVQPDTASIHTLIGIYLACGLTGLFTAAIFLRPLHTEGKDRDTVMLNLLKCCSALKDTNLLLLIPICLSQTVNASILYTGFTKAITWVVSNTTGKVRRFYIRQTSAFVSCTVGVKMVGYVMMAYGITVAFSSAMSGFLAKYTGRRPLIGFSMCLDCITLLLMLLWKPEPDQVYLLFIIPCVWALGNGIMASQISPLVGIAFAQKQTAVFSNIETWGSVGYTFVLSTDHTMCLRAKLVIAFFLWLLCTVSYIVLEVRLVRKQKKMDDVVYFRVDAEDSEDDVVEFNRGTLKSHDSTVID